MKKRIYIKPSCKTVEVETGSMVCMSLHDEEATIVGAKPFSLDDLLTDEEQSDDLLN